MNINEIESLITNNSNEVNDGTLEFDLSELEIDSLEYRYGSINSVDYSGTPIIENDVIVADKDRLIEAFHEALSEPSNSVWQDDQDCIATIQTCCVYALREHLQGRVVLGTNENGLTSIDTEQLLNNMVVSITDRIKASK